MGFLDGVLEYLSYKFSGAFLLQYLLGLKHEKRIEKLQEESWFKELYNDYRYCYIINNNKTVVKFLSEPNRILMLKTDEEMRKEFVDLVKQQHTRFVGLNNS